MKKNGPAKSSRIEIKEASLKKGIHEKVKEYYNLFHAGRDRAFVPGLSRIPYGGRVYDETELVNLVDSALDFWLTSGRYAQEFERRLAAFLGVKYCLLTNSGSSANLLAVSALTSRRLKDRRLLPGDEVITVAAAFPTTVAPLIQNRLVPVFVDVKLPTYNVDCSKLERALSARTKAVMLAHTLGNPFDVRKVRSFCDRHGLWLIEDNCDALGSRYGGRFTGTFGDIATCSFYPPHHITMGEGGALFADKPVLKRVIESFRDWGRDCWCPSGKDGTCKKRFKWQFGDLPYGYDHKYVYSHFGYNLRVTDMQAAVGCAQMDKLPVFISARKRNYKRLYEGLKTLESSFVLPKATRGAEPSWFGFPLTVKENAGFSRDEIVRYLEGRKIQTRMLFAGNIIKHPLFDEIRRSNKGYRVAGDLTCTDRIMTNTFWVGLYPGLNREMIDYIATAITAFVRRK